MIPITQKREKEERVVYRIPKKLAAALEIYRGNHPELGLVTKNACLQFILRREFERDKKWFFYIKALNLMDFAIKFLANKKSVRI